MSVTKIRDNKTKDLLKDFLNTTLNDTMSTLGADCGSLFLSDFDKNELILDSLYNSAQLDIKGLRQRVGEGISGKVVDSKAPVLVKNIDTDARFRKNGFGHYRTNSFISIPLFCSRGPIGVINLADKSNGQPFSDQDFNLAVFLCKYACLTIDSIINCEELKKQKQTSEDQNSLLEKYASVGKLAAGVVHEINNPLDGVIRYTNILLNQVRDSIAQEYLLEVKRGLNRIAGITRSLLEFSHQVNSNSSNGIQKYIDIRELVKEALDMFRNRPPVDIRINNKREDLPRILDLGLSHIVINIIKNAFDAMPKGGTLEISIDMDDSAVRLHFKDTGHGISDEVMQHIFVPFFTTKSMGKGTGLGLAICKEIMDKYNGRIEVESSSGEGANFTVLIPKEYTENA